MLFKSSSRLEQFEVLYDGSVLENVRNFIYLGVNISCTGISYQAQKHLSEQTSKAFNSFSNLITDSVICVQDKIRIFDALIQPILTYGSEIWEFYKSDDIEKVHLRKRGSYMSAHVLLNLLSELGKRDKMRGLPSI